MVILLISSILALGLIAIAIYFWQKLAKTSETIELPPPPPSQLGSLFASADTEQLAESNEAREPEPFAEAENAGSKQLPDELIQSWRESPDRVSTTRLLHAAALSDSADTYRNAVELVLDVWHKEGISEMSAAELQTLFNSEFWILSSAARTSGAGFVLKRTLSRAKRDLERANNPT
ncbi:MAG TPA: hypothetical protein VFY61_08785 [Pyrinomonadaceae bacterium]|nr:hypothetical protein [Pyrinomonadaceae bacterium]